GGLCGAPRGDAEDHRAGRRSGDGHEFARGTRGRRGESREDDRAEGGVAARAADPGPAGADTGGTRDARHEDRDKDRASESPVDSESEVGPFAREADEQGEGGLV